MKIVLCCQNNHSNVIAGAYVLIKYKNTINLKNATVMKNPIHSIRKNISALAAVVLIFVSMIISSPVFAQETVEINGQDVGSWFENNWIWVVGGVLLLILIIALTSRGSRSRKTTTIVKDTAGNVKSVTTTEENV